MLETQNSTPVAIAPFLEAPSSDAQRQALPIPLAGKPAFAGLMSAMVGEAQAANLPKGLPGAAAAAPGFASVPLSSSSDLVLAQLGVKPLSAEELQQAEQALESLGLAENLPGLVKNEADLVPIATATEQETDVEKLPVSTAPVVVKEATPAAAPVSVVSVETAGKAEKVLQDNPFIRSVSKVKTEADVVTTTPNTQVAEAVDVVKDPVMKQEAAPLESVTPEKPVLTDIIKAHELTNEADSLELVNNAVALPQQALPTDQAIVIPTVSATPSQAVKAEGTAPVVETVAPVAEEESAALAESGLNAAASAQAANDAGQQTLQTSEKLSSNFDKIAPKVDRTETTTTWGTQTQTAAAAGQAASAASSQGGQPGQQQGQGQQAQQQAMTQQLQQAQLSAEQQVKNKFAEEMTAVKAGESADKDRSASLLGDLGVGFDKRAQLPLGMQSINTPVRHSQWGQALGQRVVVMANLKVQEAKITLNPERLGPVQVKLHMDKDQQIHVTMLAQHGTTREAMENAVPKLKEMLEQAGINFGSVDVGDQRDFEQAQKDAAAHRGHKSGTGGASADDDSVEPSPVHLSTTNNLIDYYA